MKAILSILLFCSACLASAEQVIVDGVTFTSLKEAQQAIKNGSKVYLKAGFYFEGLYTSANNIEIIGEENVIFDDAAVDGKAALVLAGNNVLVESIECQHIKVRDKNGACIRFEGKNLTLRNIYAHDSESGVMTSSSDGFLTIEYSRFERLGGKAQGRGYAHAIYAKVNELNFRYSTLLNMQGEGTGIKSRSKRTIIEHSILASLYGKDSRLVDVANYGELIIKNSVLQQGDASANSQLIAYGLEKVPKKTATNRIEIHHNLILLDRKKANVIIAQKQADEVSITDNVLVGDFLYPDSLRKDNIWYFSRNDAKLLPFPYLPSIDELPRLLEIISIVGEPQ
jgi:hypothetical protein